MATDWEQVARQAARANGLDEDIFARQINAESGFNPNARSSAGASGIAQIMPGTAKGWGVDPMNPRAALGAAASNMRRYVDTYGSYRDALVAYNAGPGRVGKPLYDETRGYVNKILGGANPPASGARSAPLSGGSIAGGAPSAASFILQGSGLEHSLPQPVAPAAAGGGAYDSPAPTSGSTNSLRKDGEPWYAYLRRVGQERFGLQNDPGDSQTTGGRHSAGSEHYSQRAVDFGDARNSRQQLNAWRDWTRAQGFDALDEGDHIHVSAPGGGI